MMLGLDVKLTTSKLSKEYKNEIVGLFPKAFKPIETSWYGYGPEIIEIALRGKNAKPARGWVSLKVTKRMITSHHKRFYDAIKTTEPTTCDHDSIMPGVGMWTSFDVLSHYGDIVFAASRIFADGHEVAIKYREC